MISVIGGTYREVNYDEINVEIFGSGLRCCKYLLENDAKVSFHTSGNIEVDKYLKRYEKVYDNLIYTCNKSDYLVTFKYYFDLDEPLIFPSIPFIQKTNPIKVSDNNIICYGMLESDCKINGKCVVYDPQTSIKPIAFSQFGEAEKLVYIINWNEARSIASSDNLDAIKKYFFETEKAYAFIIKNGPLGAILFHENKQTEIPSYKTNSVYKIGSGDIFTASFSFHWMIRNCGIEEAANIASKSTAVYCDSNIYSANSVGQDFPFEPFKQVEIEQRQVYLASPIFSLSELTLIDKIRTAFLDIGVKVFSPFHDIGLGDESTIPKLDLEGIDKSDIVFCVLDNIDPGTLIEAGYSMAKEKKIIGYHRTCKKGDLLMLAPGNTFIYNNLTTAIYQTIWNL